MPLTTLQSVTLILLIAAGTQLTRWMPFLLFPDKEKLPQVVLYLGTVLPTAMIGLLVVYCLKGVDWIGGSRGLPEIIAMGSVVILHLWKRNVLLSVGAGTAVYMVLVQSVFV